MRLKTKIQRTFPASSPELWLLLLSLILLQLDNPLPAPWNNLAVVFAMVPFLWLVLARFRKKQIDWRERLRKVYQVDRTLAAVLGAYFLTLLISFIRGSLTFLTPLKVSLNLEVLIGFGLVVLLEPVSRDHRRAQSEYLLASLWLMVAFNLLLLLLGFRSNGLMYDPALPWPNSRLLRLFGLEVPVVLFPLAAGVNSFGTILGAMGASLLLSVYKRAGGNWRRFVYLAPLGAAVIILLLFVDSRGALLFAAIAVFIGVAVGTKYLKWVPWLVLSSIALPLLFAVAASKLPASAISTLKLGDVETVRQLSGRSEIWQEAIEELSDFKWVHLIGYGYAGDVSAGVASGFIDVRTSAGKPQLIGLHNFALQHIFDVGYMGAALGLLVMFLLVRRIIDLRNEWGDGLLDGWLGLIIYLSLIGSLERAPMPYSYELFGLYVLMGFLLLGMMMDDHDELALSG